LGLLISSWEISFSAAKAIELNPRRKNAENTDFSQQNARAQSFLIKQCADYGCEESSTASWKATN